MDPWAGIDAYTLKMECVMHTSLRSGVMHTIANLGRNRVEIEVEIAC